MNEQSLLDHALALGFANAALTDTKDITFVPSLGIHRPHPLAPTISPGSPAQSMSSRVSLLCRALAGLVWPSSMGSSMSHMVCITSARGQRRIRWRSIKRKT